jgi:hypothetical protein
MTIITNDPLLQEGVHRSVQVGNQERFALAYFFRAKSIFAQLPFPIRLGYTITRKIGELKKMSDSPPFPRIHS